MVLYFSEVQIWDMYILLMRVSCSGVYVGFDANQISARINGTVFDIFAPYLNKFLDGIVSKSYHRNI